MTVDPMRQADIARRVSNLNKAPRCRHGPAPANPAGRQR